MERGVRVVPVLVQGAGSPKPEDLPEELAISRRSCGPTYRKGLPAFPAFPACCGLVTGFPIG
jgi:hypothetical protein